MYKNVGNTLAIIIVLIISACSQDQEKGKYQTLSPSEFSKKIKEVPSAPVVDVRTPEEFDNGHLENAKNINWNGEDFETQISELDKSEPVFVYCLSGGRSSAAVDKMRSLGFSEIYELKGGITKWRSESFPEVNNVSGNAEGITMEEFKSLLNTDKLVLVDFYAEWCGPCKKMEPYLEELKTEMKETVKIVRVDVDENPKLSSELNVEALPMLLLYKDKELIWSHAGYISKEDVVKQLQE